jgi:DNA repair exonuclease SbcCD ATPase subunit
MPDLSPEVRAEAATAAHDAFFEEIADGVPRDAMQETWDRLVDAVVSVVLPAQVDALKAELKRELQAEDEAAETARNRRLAERIEADTDVMPFDEALQLACRVGEANLDVSGPRVVQLVKKIDQLKAELNALRAGADELQAENERLREEAKQGARQIEVARAYRAEWDTLKAENERLRHESDEALRALLDKTTLLDRIKAENVMARQFLEDERAANRYLTARVEVLTAALTELVDAVSEWARIPHSTEFLAVDVACGHARAALDRG